MQLQGLTVYSSAMRVSMRFCGILLLMTSLLCSQLSADKLVVEKPSRKQKAKLIGWVERVKLLPTNLELEAKIAPAVALSALHAENIQDFKRKGKDYVRFSLEDRQGKIETLEFPLKGQKKTTTAAGTSHKKRVISFLICIAGKKLEVEALLSDRSELDQELRLGRNVISGHFHVDPSRTHSTKPVCKGK